MDSSKRRIHGANRCIWNTVQKSVRSVWCQNSIIQVDFLPIYNCSITCSAGVFLHLWAHPQYSHLCPWLHLTNSCILFTDTTLLSAPTPLHCSQIHKLKNVNYTVLDTVFWLFHLLSACQNFGSCFKLLSTLRGRYFLKKKESFLSNHFTSKPEAVRKGTSYWVLSTFQFLTDCFK